MSQKTSVIPFPEQDVKAACDALSSNLEADDPAAWTEEDEKTPVMQHLSDEYTTAFVKNGKING
jgi:hypothetical protein